MPSNEHHAQSTQPVACGLITVSDTRTIQTDESGRIMKELLVDAGHRIVEQQIVPDEPSRIRDLCLELCGRKDCQALLLTGGTGIAKRDTTIETVSAFFERRLDGFGELFRMLSFEQVEAAAMLSRAAAGVCRDTIVFAMPGSPTAVRLALERLILPTLGHVVQLLGKQG